LFDWLSCSDGLPRPQMDDIEALNFDDLSAVAKLTREARYNDILQARLLVQTPTAGYACLLLSATSACFAEDSGTRPQGSCRGRATTTPSGAAPPQRVRAAMDEASTSDQAVADGAVGGALEEDPVYK
jgi:hypothetical protein